MSETSRFRKKPVVIEAMQFTGGWKDSGQRILEWTKGNCIVWRSTGDGDAGGVLAIRTLEGEMIASPGDWIICGVKGELYPCKPDIFAATYEAVAEVAAEGQDNPSSGCTPSPSDAAGAKLLKRLRLARMNALFEASTTLTMKGDSDSAASVLDAIETYLSQSDAAGAGEVERVRKQIEQAMRRLSPLTKQGEDAIWRPAQHAVEVFAFLLASPSFLTPGKGER